MNFSRAVPGAQVLTSGCISTRNLWVRKSDCYSDSSHIIRNPSLLTVTSFRKGETHTHAHTSCLIFYIFFYKNLPYKITRFSLYVTIKVSRLRAEDFVVHLSLLSTGNKLTFLLTTSETRTSQCYTWGHPHASVHGPTSCV